MSRRSQSTLEDILDITSKLPWWAGLTLAVTSYLALHWYANQDPPKADELKGLSAVVLPSMLRGIATFGQVILPIVFLSGAALSAFNGYKRGKLYTNTAQGLFNKKNPLEGMSWQDFELLIGEHFRRQGFKVTETAGGADGGIDLIAMKDGAKYLIQCKKWKAYKVGVKVVRELLGVMVGAGATGGFVVTSGEFTRDAVSFARDNNISLLDGDDLQRIISEQPGSHTLEGPVLSPRLNNTVKQLCPQCGEALVLRTAKKGKNPGKQFYGCSSFPRCRYTKAA